MAIDLTMSFELCSKINEELRLDFTDEENRLYPKGRCVGVREKNSQYVPVVLRFPTRIQKFEIYFGI